jgi:hypothetical protein
VDHRLDDFATNLPDCDRPGTRRTVFDFVDERRRGDQTVLVNFYFTFAFSVSYEPFIPLEGIDDTSTLFYGEDVNDPSNQALIAFRKEILEILLTLDPGIPQVFHAGVPVATEY